METVIIRLNQTNCAERDVHGLHDRTDKKLFDSGIAARLRSEARRDVFINLVLALVAVAPMSIVIATKSFDFLFHHSILTTLLLISFVLFAVFGVITLVSSPWWIDTRLSRPRLCTPEQAVNEYFENIRNTDFTWLPFACLSARERMICGGHRKFSLIWKETIEVAKRLNRRYVDAKWPNRYRIRRFPTFDYDIIDVRTNRSPASAVVRFFFRQHYEYLYDYEGVITEYLDGPVVFEITVGLVVEDDEWHLEGVVPNVEELKEIEEAVCASVLDSDLMKG